jgi:hypothetical protein
MPIKMAMRMADRYANTALPRMKRERMIPVSAMKMKRRRTQ